MFGALATFLENKPLQSTLFGVASGLLYLIVWVIQLHKTGKFSAANTVCPLPLMRYKFLCGSLIRMLLLLFCVAFGRLLLKIDMIMFGVGFGATYFAGLFFNLYFCLE